jgi:hypothetical protein
VDASVLSASTEKGRAWECGGLFKREGRFEEGVTHDDNRVLRTWADWTSQNYLVRYLARLAEPNCFPHITTYRLKGKLGVLSPTHKSDTDKWELHISVHYFVCRFASYTGLTYRKELVSGGWHKDGHNVLRVSLGQEAEYEITGKSWRSINVNKILMRDVSFFFSPEKEPPETSGQDSGWAPV